MRRVGSGHGLGLYLYGNGYDVGCDYTTSHAIASYLVVTTFGMVVTLGNRGIRI